MSRRKQYMSLLGVGPATRGMETDNKSWKPRLPEAVDPAVRIARLKKRLVVDAQNKADPQKIDKGEWDTVCTRIRANGDHAEDLLTNHDIKRNR